MFLAILIFLNIIIIATAKQWSLEPIISIARPRISATDNHISVASLDLDMSDNAHTIPNTFNVSIRTYTAEGMEKHSCNVSVTTLNKFAFIIFFQLTALGDDNDTEILTWIDNDATKEYLDPYLVLRIVDMRSCTFDESKIDIYADVYYIGNDKFISVLPYKSRNEFDLFFPNKLLCGGNGCKVTFNAEGNVIGDLVPLNFDEFTAFWSAVSVSPDSSQKGYFIYRKLYRDLKVVLINASGEVTKSNTFKTNALTMNSKEFAISESSSAEETLTFCFLMTKTKIHCTQIDANLDVRMSASLDFKKDILYMKIQNLPHGFILMTVLRREQNYENYGIYLTKIYSNGDHSEPVDVENIQCDFNRVDLFSTNGGIPCVSFTCVNSIKDSAIYKKFFVHTKCIDYYI